MSDRLGHCYIGRRLVNGLAVLFARCSCGQEYEGRGAGSMLDAHLDDCPDEADYLTPSAATEQWAEDHYDDRAITFQEWKDRR